MKVWLVSFLLVFGVVELFQWIMGIPWLQDATLPMPVFILGGTALAIASNSNKRAGLPWQSLWESESVTNLKAGMRGAIASNPSPSFEVSEPHPVSQVRPGPQLPDLSPQSPQQPVSFKVRKSDQLE